ncbi:MAG: membrane dipeptidase, partial [Actinomycetota bacterium]|nr:membrane dipeptidase [Actinomycetota bacterium]
MFQRGRVEVSKYAREFHDEALVIDLHTDSLIASRLLGLDLAKRHRTPAGLTPWMLHADIPRLQEGGVDAVFLGIVVAPYSRGAFKRAVRNIKFGESVIENNRELVSFAASAEDIKHARERGKIAFAFGVEGMHALEGKLENLEKLYSLGVRYITMAHFTSNEFVASSASRRKSGITPKGREAVELANSLGMIVDVSHTHAEAIEEVTRISRAPVIVSHGAASALHPTFRNLRDEDILNIARTGGVIGLIYASYWL